MALLQDSVNSPALCHRIVQRDIDHLDIYYLDIIKTYMLVYLSSHVKSIKLLNKKTTSTLHALVRYMLDESYKD